MPPSNTGSFGNGQASPELLAAIQRRQTSGGPMNAVTTSAPTYDPTQQPTQVQPISSPMPSGQPISPSGVGVPTPQGEGMQLNIPESELIISALSARLKSFSKQEEARLGI